MARLGYIIGMNALKYFPDISSDSWEHPADRAALNAFRSLPGADILVKKFVSLTSEKSMRLVMLASAARVGERQYPTLYAQMGKLCDLFGLKRRPELYVSQNPFFNAGAYGVDNPFIVLNSSLVDGLLDEVELQYVLGHELGHILSGHALYKTLLWFVLRLSSMALSQFPIAQISLQGLVLALGEWDRKSELSADRAGLLAVQDEQSPYTALMKSAGGRNITQLDIGSFLEQAREYDASADALDSLYKLLNTLEVSHPYPVIRIAELKTWEKTGYRRIMDGEYQRVGSRREDLGRDWAEAAQQYKEDFQASSDPLAKVAGNIAKGAEDLLKNAGRARQDIEDFLSGLFK